MVGSVFAIKNGLERKCKVFVSNQGSGIRVRDVRGGELIYEILDSDGNKVDVCHGCFSADDLVPLAPAGEYDRIGVDPAEGQDWQFDRSDIVDDLKQIDEIVEEAQKPKPPKKGTRKMAGTKTSGMSLNDLIVSREDFDQAVASLTQADGVLLDELGELKSQIANNQPVQVVIDAKAGKVEAGEIRGLKHRQFMKILNLVIKGHPVMLVGPAGSGKTHVASQVAEAAKLDFYTMSVGMQTSKSDLFGFIHAGGEYVPSLFRKAFEGGGLFLLDEMDAGNSNVILLLNTALANGYAAFPDKMVHKHEDFRIVASANTVGSGADHIYVGRNQLDFSTVDRFLLVKWEYDPHLEDSLVKNKALLKVAKTIREVIEKSNIPVVFSTRTLVAVDTLTQQGVSLADAYSIAFFDKLAVDDARKIQSALSGEI